MSSPLTLCWHVLQVNQKLQLISQGKWVDETPEERRSPSPEPIYNDSGARTNTREQRAKDKLLRQRNVSGCCTSSDSSAQQRGGVAEGASLSFCWQRVVVPGVLEFFLLRLAFVTWQVAAAWIRQQ